MKSLIGHIRLMSVIVLMAVLVGSCSKIDRGYDEGTAFKVLVLGNSLSRDAFSYAPWIMENVCRGMMLDMEILYVGGASLSTHMSYINEDKASFIHDIYKSRTHSWYSDTDVRASDVVTEKDWDLIVFQEGSGNSRNCVSFMEDIRNLRQYFDTVVPDPHYAVMMNPSRPDGASALEGKSSLEDYKAVAAVASEILDEGVVEFVIPCGTAVQHARMMSLDGFGDYGHMSFDGKHLQEGVPCQTEAYVVAQSLINYANRYGSIDDCTIKATGKWVNERFIPGRHGSAQDASDIQYELAKYCARMAMEEPFSIDYIEFRKHYPSLFGQDGIMLEAHRGLSDEYPENSVPAFEAAGKSELYKAIETDVQCTKDGVLVCMHDNTLERTTDGRNAVKDYSYSQLSKLFLTGGMGWSDEFAGSLRIPTFEEYLDICRKYGKIPYVELKNLNTKGIQSVIDMLHSKGYSDDEYVLTSFSPDNLAAAARSCKAPLEIMKDSFSDEELETYASKRNYTVRPLAENVTAEFVKKCHDLGLFAEVWNLSTDKYTASKTIAMGIDGGTCNTWKIMAE